MNIPRTEISRKVLNIDCKTEVDMIVAEMKRIVHGKYHKKGVVLGISGGVDSSVVAGLCVRAFGRDKVLALSMPEYDSSEETRTCTDLLVENLGLELTTEPIGDILHSLKCYERRNDAIRRVIPEFQDDWKCKIALPRTHETGQLSFYSIIVSSPSNRTISKRLPLSSYLEIVAASNFKQRVRKMIEYYHADRLNYAVVGTPNYLEYDQGFFVKNGDGAADIKPIAHLYKSQVYQIADYLNLPREIIEREPTTDTYSMPQSQEEFYFTLPYDEMDLCLHGLDNNIPAEEIGESIGRPAEQIERVFRQIQQKRRVAHYLSSQPRMIRPVNSAVH